MIEIRFVYVALYAIVTVLAVAVVVIALQHRGARGALSLAFFMTGIAIWSFACAAMWSSTTLGGQVLWLAAKNLGIWMVPVGFLTAAFEIARMDRWLTPVRIGLMSVASFLSTNMEWLNPGGLFNTEFVPHRIGPYTHYQPVPGPLYWVSDLVPYTLVTAAFVIISGVYRRSRGVERTQAGILLAGGTLPFVLSVFTEFQSVPVGLDLAPLAFLITGPMWLGAILRGEMLEVVPVARSVLVEQMADGVLVLDQDDRVVDVNPMAREMVQGTGGQAPGARKPADPIGKPADVVLSCVQGAAEVLHGNGARHAVLPLSSDGDSRYVEMGVTPLAVGLGNPPAQLVTLHDMTEERRASEGLKLAGKVFETASEGIIVSQVDDDERVVEVNDAFCRLTERAREDVVGTSLKELQSVRHPRGFYRGIEQSALATGTWTGEVWQARSDGTAFPSLLSVTVAKDENGDPSHIVQIFTDITEAREAAERLRENATHDSLTGLPNRILLDDRLEGALAHARRVGGMVAVIFLDLDHFKSVNDTLGHDRGDALLIEVAESIKSVLRDSDTVARRGGDEFTIVMSDVSDPVQAEITARRVLHAISSRPRLGQAGVHISGSAGIALFPSDSDDATTLMRHADVAMYGAKELGSNRARFFSEELQERLNRHTAIERELWGALEEARYFILYQPRVDLATGEITGVEALARLYARDGTVLSPDEFIPVAEDSELIIRLGDWVLRQACAELALLHEAAPALCMSVNLSARQFREIDMTTLLNDVLQGCGLGPRFLELEITETAFLIDRQEAVDKLEELRDVAGIRVSLDDFGTGYSSFTYVRMFKANTIKIDRSFVALLPDNAEARAIVLSTIALAEGLGATVVAEGAETEEQVRFLIANGCDCAQGYYFSPPVPPDELVLLLRQGPFDLPAPPSR